MGKTEEEYQRALENTLEWQIRKFRVAVSEFVLAVGDPLWQFIKRHPRLYWLWNKSYPLIKAICWFSPFDWEEVDGNKDGWHR